MAVWQRRSGVAIEAVATVAIAAVAYVLLAAPHGFDLARPKVASAQEQTQAAGSTMWVLTNGRLSSLSPDQPNAPRMITSVACDRVYAAAGTVVCLQPVDERTTTHLVVLDAHLDEQLSIPLTGFPNRLRISPSGRMVAWTLLVNPHSADPSYSTGILDTSTGRIAGSLGQFAITKDGRPYRSTGVRFWCLTFADDNRFYASMAADGRAYLVKGDVAARRVQIMAAGVDCPSLSPDGSRLAFKHVNGATHPGHSGPDVPGALSVMDLGSLRITHLTEAGNVDDQVIWLDNATIAYALQRSDGTNDVWSVPTDATGTARLFVPEANSPSPPQ
jgi:WD40-like Beta Propeller Repeat